MISVPVERVIYLRYDIALRAMIYAFGIWRNGYYIMLAAGKYIIRQRRISYCVAIYHFCKGSNSYAKLPKISFFVLWM